MPPPLPPHYSQPESQPEPKRWIPSGISILFVAFICFRLVQAALNYKGEPRHSDPRAEALSQATKLIVGARRGVAHGNSDEAKELAEQLSERLKEIRRTMFSAGNASSWDRQLNTKGDFLTFCQLTQDSCAF